MDSVQSISLTNLNQLFFLEYVSNGLLENLLSLSKKGLAPHNFDDTQKLIILYGIGSEMSHLHSFEILHRDLKPGNVFLDDDYPKMCDCGISKKENDEKRSTIGFKGTVLYSAPECMQLNQYSKSSNVYSFAILAYEIITNQDPYPCIENEHITYEKVKKGKRPRIDKFVGNAEKELIEKCLAQAPSDRPTFDEIKEALENNPDFLNDKDEKRLC